MPFREAHGIAGKVVAMAEQKERSITSLTVEELQKIWSVKSFLLDTKIIMLTAFHDFRVASDSMASSNFCYLTPVRSLTKTFYPCGTTNGAWSNTQQMEGRVE